VLIPPFTDTRPDIEDNHSWLHLIPLMPFGWFELSRPDGIASLKIPTIFSRHGGEKLARREGQFYPTIHLAKAARDELGASGVFSSVFFNENAQANEGDLLLQGHIRSTR